MEEINEKYRRILQEIVERYAQEPRRPDQAKLIPVEDTAHDNYLLMRVGWDRRGRAHNVLFHLRLEDGKVWVEQDGIAHGIATDLLEAGIEKDDIFLAFYGREPKPLTELSLT